MKANFDFNRLSESRKQELDRMVADFSEAGCLFVEDLFLEFLIDADNGMSLHLSPILGHFCKVFLKNLRNIF